jgi:phenylpropionate dioxygenase-like ring-hydroxylating dioxygenase large terminal subunit
MGSPTKPDWVQANPTRIAASLSRALAKPSGGWHVLGASRSYQGSRLTRTSALGPWRETVADQELVLWRSDVAGPLHVASAVCPHMGAHLGGGRVVDGCLVCPWHGLAVVSSVGHGRWSTLPVHDDGVLTWVQLDPTAADALPSPIMAKRPDVFLDGVIRRDATCEPRDVIANRLDPWHGAHFHPYAFTGLRVVEERDDAIDLEVAYKVVGKYSVAVTARFETPDPHTIVMTIIDGEGTGSVVETHARLITAAATGRPPRTAVIEATLATSDRQGFEHSLKGAAIARPLIKLSAARLWKDDAAYAERLYELRAR